MHIGAVVASAEASLGTVPSFGAVASEVGAYGKAGESRRGVRHSDGIVCLCGVEERGVLAKWWGEGWL